MKNKPYLELSFIDFLMFVVFSGNNFQTSTVNLLFYFQALEEKLVRLEESFLCCICRDSEIATALCPCGHVTCCSECSEKLTECPLCRKKIEHIQRIFLPTNSLLKCQSSMSGKVHGIVGLSKL